MVVLKKPASNGSIRAHRLHICLPSTSTGHATIPSMFDEQDGICTVCGHEHRLTRHHKVPKAKGGSDLESNLVGVCRACHDQIHEVKTRGGVSRGCADYPDMIAAAAASQAHWDKLVMAWRYGAVTGVRPYRNRILAERLIEALKDIEPRCT